MAVWLLQFKPTNAHISVRFTIILCYSLVYIIAVTEYNFVRSNQNVEVKVIFVHAMKVYRVSRGVATAPLIFNLTARWR
jgi:hypothetical protein